MQVFPSNPNFIYEDYQSSPYDTYHTDVVMVLDSVKSLFSKYFDSVDARPLSIINNAPNRNSPEALREQHIIFLAVDATDENGEPGCYWCQFIYQFAHEFCHYIIPQNVAQTMRWFEESLCELSSQFFLLKSAEQWCIKPPYPDPKWRKNALSILDYEINILNANSTFPMPDLFNPFSGLLKSLEKDEYQRELNRNFAICLLPYFIDRPSLWKIMCYLPELPGTNAFSQNLHLLQKLSGQPIQQLVSSLAEESLK